MNSYLNKRVRDTPPLGRGGSYGGAHGRVRTAIGGAQLLDDPSGVWRDRVEEMMHRLEVIFFFFCVCV